jgi:diguanylate cyclase (GGDEF)-like protein
VLWAGANRKDGIPSGMAQQFDLQFLDSPGSLLKRVRELKPDLILLGGELPDRSDYLTDLLQVPGVDLTPVLVLADSYDDAEAARCLDLGVADYVSSKRGARELRARMDKAIREGRQRREWAQLARTDALTGLANFGALMSRLEEEFSRASRYQHPLSVVMIDLDHLKEINDRFGHDAGNRAICALARTLRAGLRQTDFAARYGGDEFVILLPYQSPTDALAIVERLRRSVSELEVPGPEGEKTGMQLSLSAGISGHTPGAPAQSVEVLLQQADAALYQAKREGRNRAVVLDERARASESRA